MSTQASGRHTWFWSVRVAGNLTRVRIGRWPEVKTDAARKAAMRCAAKVVEGTPLPTPANKRAAREAEQTLGQLFMHYMSTKARNNRTKERSEREFKRWYGDWRNRPSHTISKSEVRERISKIADDAGNSPALKAYALLSVIYNTAIEADLIDQYNPASKAAKNIKVEPRTRYLKESEMAAFFKRSASYNAPSPATTSTCWLPRLNDAVQSLRCGGKTSTLTLAPGRFRPSTVRRSGPRPSH